MRPVMFERLLQLLDSELGLLDGLERAVGFGC